MTGPSRGLLDTSVFTAAENGRLLNEELLPAESAISVVTLAELHAGVLAARDTETRAMRMTTLDALADVQLIPIDAGAAVTGARLRVHLAETGRRIGVNALWIAAFAAAHNLPVITQDNDFDVLDGVAGLAIVRV
ncbi:MAG: PIN domain-containing protein [Actinobacteria bacterium]|nr:PIN domain-containing protein [Actinomycetota bacterium]